MSEEKVQLNLKTVGSDPTVHLGKKKTGRKKKITCILFPSICTHQGRL